MIHRRALPEGTHQVDRAWRRLDYRINVRIPLRCEVENTELGPGTD